MSNLTSFDQILISGQNVSVSGNNLYVNGILVNPKPIGFAVDGAGSNVVSGIKQYITCPYTGTAISWSIVAPQSGILGIDIYKIGSGVVLPTASIINGGAYPSLTGNAIAYSTGVSNWSNLNFSPNDIIGWVVTGSPTVTKFTFTLNIL